MEYPQYFMDFETIMPVVPLYDETRAYQQIPFQYSLDVIKAPGKEPEHYEFLGTPPDDPRVPFIRSLIKNIGKKGSILTWNQGFETARLNEIARDLPDFEIEIASLVERVVDLMSPFRSKHFYTPEL